MNPEAQRNLIAETREDAIAFLEDFEHLTDITQKSETRPIDLRHSSAVLRRWLVEGMLQRVGSPRVGRIHISAIDNNPIYRVARSGRVHCFISGGASVHGVFIASGMVNKDNRPLDVEGYHPDSLTPFKLETFRKQKVIFADGEWITRDQVIKFVANVDRGVHAGKVKERWEQILANFRYQVSVSLVDHENGQKIPSIVWGVGKPAVEATPREYDPSKVNGTLLELLATAHFLISSSSVLDLADAVRSELKAS